MTGAVTLVPEGLEAVLVLLRHGESEWIVEGRFQGRSETPLSPLGRRQAEAAATRLAHPYAPPRLPIPASHPREIVQSPLARAVETATAVARAMGDVAVRGDHGLTEIGQGAWEGETHDDIARRWPDELAAWRRRPHEAWAPGGESPAAVRARVLPALARVLRTLAADAPRGSLERPQVAGYPGVDPYPERPWSLLVAHDGVFKVLLLTLFDLPLDRFWMFTMGLCGISVVDIRGGRPVLRAHNLTEHTAPLDAEGAPYAMEQRSRAGAL